MGGSGVGDSEGRVVLLFLGAFVDFDRFVPLPPLLDLDLDLELFALFLSRLSVVLSPLLFLFFFLIFRSWNHLALYSSESDVVCSTVPASADVLSKVD